VDEAGQDLLVAGPARRLVQHRPVPVQADGGQVGHLSGGPRRAGGPGREVLDPQRGPAARGAGAQPREAPGAEVAEVEVGAGGRREPSGGHHLILPQRDPGTGRQPLPLPSTGVGIVDEDIQAVRAATDIVQVVSKYTQLRRSGTRWVGLCPFHAEKTPSFNVNQELGLYRCWGCQVRGDVITFVREVEHLDFVAAVELLAGWAGITLRYTDRDEGAGRKRRAVLVSAMEQAVEWYHQRLLAAPDAAAARRYLRERGLTGEEVRAFRLGWAPDAWDELTRALRLPDDVVRDTGLGFLNRNGRQTDAFRG